MEYMGQNQGRQEHSNEVDACSQSEFWSKTPLYSSNKSPANSVWPQSWQPLLPHCRKCLVSLSQAMCDQPIDWEIAKQFLFCHILHPTDSDAGWNSIQHPTWPQALSEEFTPAINDWWMGLVCFDMYRHWGTYTHMFDTNHSLWNGPMTEFYVRGMRGWRWVESFQTQRGCWVEIWGVLGENCMRK